MSRILLADDSAHAQRIGEMILREEGYEVVTVTDGETVVVRLPDVDPDVILADVTLPQRNGYELCRYVKSNPRFQHTRVVLTAGALEPLEEEEIRDSQADATLRKPFEASAMMEVLRPLIEAAQSARLSGPAAEEPPRPAEQAAVSTEREEREEEDAADAPDAERVHAAVTLALDAAFPAMVEELTARVLAALKP